jgi:hypothetical protein
VAIEEPAIQPDNAQHQQTHNAAEQPQRSITATNDKGPGANQGGEQNRTGFVANVRPHFTCGRESRDAHNTGFVAP